MDILRIYAIIVSLGMMYFWIMLYRLNKENEVLKIAIIEEIAKKNLLIDKDTQEAQEQFLKFVSDSREWAYDYIDNVQTELKKFIDIADKEFAFFDKFGILTEQYPNYEAMKKISEEYKKLKKLLPEDNNV